MNGIYHGNRKLALENEVDFHVSDAKLKPHNPESGLAVMNSFVTPGEGFRNAHSVRAGQSAQRRQVNDTCDNLG